MLKNFVEGSVYYNNYGDPIPFGSPIDMSFAGAPYNMKWPFRLLSATNFYSTVGYRNEVTLLVIGSNQMMGLFDFAEVYNPRLLVSKESET